MKFTAIIEQGESCWYVGQIERHPSQAPFTGETILELKANLLDAEKVEIYTNKEITDQEYLTHE